MIGFRQLGKSFSSSISKWEQSFFGGFYRLVADYPRVKLDENVEFDFAPNKGGYLSYFEKEKICKIFLSRVNSLESVDALMKDAKTTTSKNLIGGNDVRILLNEHAKLNVLEFLRRNDKEYSPFFSHYKNFICKTEIYFKVHEPKAKDGSGSGGDGGTNKDKDNRESQEKQDQNNNKKESQQGIREKSQKYINDFRKALKSIKEQVVETTKLSKFNKNIRTVTLKGNYDSQFTEQEKDTADRLTNMLDISFDPAEDTVKNLRLGKLDVAKIAEVPAGNIAVYKQTVENQTTKPFSVAILCDESGSMGMSSRLETQYSIVKSLYRTFSDILPQEKIFIYGHSGGTSPELRVYHDPYNQNFLSSIDCMLNNSHNENYDGPIIEEVHKSIRSMTSDRIIFIVLSDGQPSGYEYGSGVDIMQMKQIIEKCKRDEFVTVGIGIESFHVNGLYQYSTVVNNMSDMPKKVSHIVNHVVKTEFK